MGTFDTIGGTPRHDPAFDGGDPPPHEEAFLMLLERSAALRVEARDIRDKLVTALNDALAVLLPPGTMVTRDYSRDGAPWLQNPTAISGNDRGARTYEIAGPPSVGFDESHPDLSYWRADAYPINEHGKRLSGRTARGHHQDTVRIRARVVLTNDFETMTEAQVNELLTNVIAAAHEKRTTTED